MYKASLRPPLLLALVPLAIALDKYDIQWCTEMERFEDAGH
jgi:hypothetical protein